MLWIHCMTSFCYLTYELCKHIIFKQIMIMCVSVALGREEQIWTAGVIGSCKP